MKLLKQLKWNLILLAVLFIALGVVLIVWPSATMTSICYIFGYHTGTAGCGIFDRLSEKRCDRYYIPVRSGDRTEPDPGRCAGVYQSGQANGPGAGGAGISDHHQRYLETAKFRRPSAAGTRNLACGICTGYH